MHSFTLSLALVGCASWLAAQAEPAPPFDLDAAFAAARPPLAEARWTLVPWRHSLTDALAEAKANNKPVYLFVNDGDVESGRC
ncbi:MAG: hypothetical protein H6838_08355 [Planctomycetes bacterium]|nr:hypothetical protein [Planctomycetota bacterium]MCB9885489.1 hypothetical protein [Planctomycetota bacterium]